jgi:hypothetical protein
MTGKSAAAASKNYKVLATAPFPIGEERRFFVAEAVISQNRG